MMMCAVDLTAGFGGANASASAGGSSEGYFLVIIELKFIISLFVHKLIISIISFMYNY